MDFDMSPKVVELRDRLMAFMDEHVYPKEPTFQEQLYAMGYGTENWKNWGPVPIVEELKIRQLG